VIVDRSPRIAGLALVLVALLGACGGTAWSQGSKADPTVLLSAINGTTAAKTARFEMHVSASAAGQSAKVDGTGVVNFATHDIEIHADIHAGARSQSAEMRAVNGTAYVNIDGQWQSKPLNASGTVNQNWDPSQFLDELRGVTDDLRETGSGSSHGDHTTKYEGTLDLNKAAASISDPDAQAKVQAAISELGTANIPMQVEIDDAERVRKVEMAMNVSTAAGSGDASVKMEFWDFGVPADITAPDGATPA